MNTSDDMMDFEMTIPYFNAHYVYQNIYLGSVKAANDREWLKKNNITHVLGLIDYQEKFKDVKYLTYGNIDDSVKQDLIKYFKQTFKFIDESYESGGNVLVHCHAGISRSSTIVIAYLMYKYNKSLVNALDITKNARSIVCPNYGFYCQLKVLDKLSFEQRKLFK